MRVVFDGYLPAGLDAEALRRLARDGDELRRGVLDSERVRAFRAVADDEEALRRVRATADRLRSRFSRLVLVGIGGSALGAATLVEALGSRPSSVVVLDNVDPEWVRRRTAGLDLRRCAVNIVSKSGGTAETAALGSMLVDRLRRRVGDAWREHVVATTDPEKGPLRALARREGLATLEVPRNVAGRFSVLTAAGLLPAAFSGVDVEALLSGARRANAACGGASPSDDPAFLAALCDARLWPSRNVCVFFVYSGLLARVADWFAQLWAESLGKRTRLDGRVEPVGQTPLAALGASDQHSLLQLFAEGPDDKTYNLLLLERPRARCPLPKAAADEWNYLSGRSLEKLFSAEAAGTERTLTDAGRPVLKILLARREEAEVGALMQWLMTRVAYVAALLEVNAFDQPGVEHGKRVARALLGDESAAAATNIVGRGDARATRLEVRL